MQHKKKFQPCNHLLIMKHAFLSTLFNKQLTHHYRQVFLTKNICSICISLKLIPSISKSHTFYFHDLLLLTNIKRKQVNELMPNSLYLHPTTLYLFISYMDKMNARYKTQWIKSYVENTCNICCISLKPKANYVFFFFSSTEFTQLKEKKRDTYMND